MRYNALADLMTNKLVTFQIYSENYLHKKHMYRIETVSESGLSARLRVIRCVVKLISNGCLHPLPPLLTT